METIKTVGVKDLKNNLSASVSLRDQWVAAGKLRPPLVPKTALSRTGVKLPVGTVRKLIDEDRDE